MIIIRSQVVCGSFHTLAISQDDLCYMWGRHGDHFTTSPIQIPEVTKVSEVAASYLVHMCALKAENVIYTFGHFVDLPSIVSRSGRHFPIRSGFRPPKLELTDFLCTDVAFAVRSKPQGMWRAMRLHEQLKVYAVTLPATISFSGLSYRDAGGILTIIYATPET